MSTQKTQGIQALLEAERKAAEIVQEARDCMSSPAVLATKLPPEFPHVVRMYFLTSMPW